jgi:orotate phosphoribosyltransferase
MSTTSILELLADAGAIITDTHVVYTSGRHGRSYVNKDALYLHPLSTRQVCNTMSVDYDADDIDIVAGPTIGGVILAQGVAGALSNRKTNGEVLAVFAEEEIVDDDKRRVFRRGYDGYIPRRRVLIVEDILTTGGSARKMVEAVRALGGEVVGLSALCNRGGILSSDLGNVLLHALTSIPLESWAEDECPLCREQIPINTSVGKGKAFLERRH